MAGQDGQQHRHRERGGGRRLGGLPDAGRCSLAGWVLCRQSLMELAKDEGLAVEERALPVTELASLREVAACGTAVVVTPVNRVVYKDEVRP